MRAEGDTRRVRREFQRLLAEGVRIRAAGTARRDPDKLLRLGYLPRHAIRLFDTTYYVTELREDPTWLGTLRFFVAYVHPSADDPGLYPHIFSKDYSLVWRSPSHFIRSARENWMGKGDVRWVVENGEESLASFEETTNLPLEIQASLDSLTRRARPPAPGPACGGADPAQGTRRPHRAL